MLKKNLNLILLLIISIVISHIYGIAMEKKNNNRANYFYLMRDNNTKAVNEITNNNTGNISAPQKKEITKENKRAKELRTGFGQKQKKQINRFNLPER